MQRLKVLVPSLLLWAQLSSVLAQTQPAAVLQSRTTSLQLPKSAYFFMDPNGSYKYAFDTGSGFMSEQSANQANEVVGHYIYHEKGVPYMVKYRSGVQGYQPELITSPALPITIPISTTAPLLQQLPAVQTNLVANYAPTLKFVQDAMAAMKTQPMHMSFVAHHTGLQQATSHQQLKPANPANPSTQPNPPTNAGVTLNPPNGQSMEINQLNTLSTPTPPALPKRPYAFSYLADQSTRSESADAAGNVMGKYAYYDEAGFHDLSYKAGDDIGFVILGGSLSTPKIGAPPSAAPVSMLPALSLPPYRAEAANLIKRSANGGLRSLRKFQQYTRW